MISRSNGFLSFSRAPLRCSLSRNKGPIHRYMCALSEIPWPWKSCLWAPQANLPFSFAMHGYIEISHINIIASVPNSKLRDTFGLLCIMLSFSLWPLKSFPTWNFEESFGSHWIYRCISSQYSTISITTRIVCIPAEWVWWLPERWKSRATKSDTLVFKKFQVVWRSNIIIFTRRGKRRRKRKGLKAYRQQDH